MGFSLVAAFAIIGVAIFISIEILTGSMLPAITDIDNSYDDFVKRSVEMVQTDINIIDVEFSENGENYDHNITVNNTGSIVLNTSHFSIIINGELQQFSCTDSYLYPEGETYFNVTNLPGTGNKRLKMTTENGISDYFEYIVG